MKKSLVTGGAGFIGSHLVEELVKHGRHVTVLDDLSNGSLENLKALRRSEYDFVKQDISRRVSDYGLWGIHGDLDEIYFMACFPRQASLSNPQRDCEVNLLGTINALELARRKGVKMLFASNTGIVSHPDHLPVDESFPSNPTTPYDCHKLASEHMLRVYAHEHRVRAVALRFASIYGPRQHVNAKIGWHPVIPEFAFKLLHGEQPTIFGSGFQTRAFVYVKDLVQGIISGMESEKTGNGEMYILGTGEETSILNVYFMIGKILGCAVTEKTPHYGPRSQGEIARMCYDCSKAHQAFGWNPHTPLQDGLRETVQSYRGNP